jgi:ADP-heptose:LPS heptosyltransferase
VSKGRILVIRGGAIGDFILTLPAIAALQKQFPQSHIEVLGYPHIVQLAQLGGLVHAVKPIEARPLAGFFARDGQLAEELSDYFSDFDIIISYLYDPDEIFRTNVKRCTRAQFIVGAHRPDETLRVHATKVFLQPLERLAIFDADPTPRLDITVSQIHPRKRIALHPGSGSERKNWSEGNWSALISRLINETEFDLLLVGGEAEGERLQRLTAILPPTRCAVAKSLSLTELAQRMKSCRAFVGHDSGITHLAAAIGLPTIALWANSVEEIWRPQGANVRVLRDASGINAINSTRVMETLNLD